MRKPTASLLAVSALARAGQALRIERGPPLLNLGPPSPLPLDAYYRTIFHAENNLPI
jgi:hypothetical protein